MCFLLSPTDHLQKPCIIQAGTKTTWPRQSSSCRQFFFHCCILFHRYKIYFNLLLSPALNSGYVLGLLSQVLCGLKYLRWIGKKSGNRNIVSEESIRTSQMDNIIFRSMSIIKIYDDANHSFTYQDRIYSVQLIFRPFKKNL